MLSGHMERKISLELHTALTIMIKMQVCCCTHEINYQFSFNIEEKSPFSCIVRSIN